MTDRFNPLTGPTFPLVRWIRPTTGMTDEQRAAGISQCYGIPIEQARREIAEMRADPTPMRLCPQ